MKFTEILEELRKGEKVTREKWENSEAKPYKYITFERGKCIACSEDYTEEGEGASYEGSIFEYDDFTAEDWKIYEEKPTRIWKPEFGEKYYYMTTNGNVGQDTFNTSFDKYRLSFRNVFKTAEEARKMVEKIKIINQLQELSNVSFYHNCEGKKYLIIYNSKLKEIDYTTHTCIRELPFNVYFATQKDCENAVKEIGEDNLKKYYFDVED